jgi:hypothetical protein
MPHDACYNRVMQSHGGKWSARAAQAVAKCRKKSGHVRKTSAGSSLRRWQRERWVDKISHKPCGAGGSTQYCRPSKRVNSHTPKMPRGAALRRAISTKKSTGHAPNFRK